MRRWTCGRGSRLSRRASGRRTRGRRNGRALRPLCRRTWHGTRRWRRRQRWCWGGRTLFFNPQAQRGRNHTARRLRGSSRRGWFTGRDRRRRRCVRCGHRLRLDHGSRRLRRGQRWRRFYRRLDNRRRWRRLCDDHWRRLGRHRLGRRRRFLGNGNRLGFRRRRRRSGHRLDCLDETRRRERRSHRLRRLSLLCRRTLFGAWPRRSGLGENIAVWQRDVALSGEPLDELTRDDFFDRARSALHLDAMVALQERSHFLARRAEQFRHLVDPDSCQALLPLTPVALRRRTLRRGPLRESSQQSCRRCREFPIVVRWSPRRPLPASYTLPQPVCARSSRRCRTR